MAGKQGDTLPQLMREFDENGRGHCCPGNGGCGHGLPIPVVRKLKTTGKVVCPRCDSPLRLGRNPLNGSVIPVLDES